MLSLKTQEACFSSLLRGIHGRKVDQSVQQRIGFEDSSIRAVVQTGAGGHKQPEYSARVATAVQALLQDILNNLMVIGSQVKRKTEPCTPAHHVWGDEPTMHQAANQALVAKFHNAMY